MGKSRIKRKATNLAVQKSMLNKEFANLIESINLANNKLIAFIMIQPSNESIKYKVRIEYKISTGPKVWLVEPKIIKTFNGKRPHHVYGIDKNGFTQLCVYTPHLNEWDSSMSLAYDFVPWIITWLSAYEFWQVTGEWVYPETRNDKKTL